MAQPLTDAKFVISAADAEQLGSCHAEVAFVGRSNVGKSSLLNALASQNQLARVSKTPGRTRLINVFLTGPDRWIVDLPGYGYAGGPRTRPALAGHDRGLPPGRPTLRMVFVLVDAEVGPTKLDLQMIDWLRPRHAPPHRRHQGGPGEALASGPAPGHRRRLRPPAPRHRLGQRQEGHRHPGPPQGSGRLLEL